MTKAHNKITKTLHLKREGNMTMLNIRKNYISISVILK